MLTPQEYWKQVNAKRGWEQNPTSNKREELRLYYISIIYIYIIYIIHYTLYNYNTIYLYTIYKYILYINRCERNTKQNQPLQECKPRLWDAPIRHTCIYPARLKSSLPVFLWKQQHQPLGWGWGHNRPSICWQWECKCHDHFSTVRHTLCIKASNPSTGYEFKCVHIHSGFVVSTMMSFNWKKDNHVPAANLTGFTTQQ